MALLRPDCDAGRGGWRAGKQFPRVQLHTSSQHHRQNAAYGLACEQVALPTWLHGAAPPASFAYLNEPAYYISFSFRFWFRLSRCLRQLLLLITYSRHLGMWIDVANGYGMYTCVQYVTYLRICENVACYRFSFHGVALTAPTTDQTPARPPSLLHTIHWEEQQHRSIAHHTHTHSLLWWLGLLIASARLLAAYVYLYISSNTNAHSPYAKQYPPGTSHRITTLATPHYPVRQMAVLPPAGYHPQPSVFGHQTSTCLGVCTLRKILCIGN